MEIKINCHDFKNNYLITFRNHTNHPIKVLQNKNNIMYMQPFYKTVPHTPSEYFCTECIYLGM